MDWRGMGAALSMLATGLAVEQACWHSLGNVYVGSGQMIDVVRLNRNSIILAPP
jgi:hypothetical protein